MKKIILILCLVFTACASSTTELKTPLTFETQSKILSNFTKQVQDLSEIASFSGVAHLKLKTQGRDFSVQEVLRIDAPQFRFESLDDFGNLLYLLQSDGKKLVIQDFQAGVRKEQKLSPKLLKRYLPLSGDLERGLGLFFGQVLLTHKDFSVEKFSVFPSIHDENHFWIQTKTRRWLWNESQQQIVAFEEYKNRRKIFRYDAFDFDWVERLNKGKKIKLPRKIWLKDLRQGSEMSLRYDFMEIQP